MKSYLLIWLAILPLILFVGACGTDYPDEIAEALETIPAEVDYNLHIKPILSDRCFQCHGPDNNTREADFRLDNPEGGFARLQVSSRNRALVPGRPGRSEVYHRLTSHDPEYRMPPPESNLEISPEEIAYIIRWIEQGAEYKPHWAFLPPEKLDLPEVSQPDWPQNEIDYFVLSKLESHDLGPSPRANREALIRRVTFDLTGLPPTPDEIEAFLNDSSPDAYEKVVDRLLDSDAYGERMASEWLDVARYADSHGYQDDGMRNMWPWRDWVIDAFNRNMPYDDFITLQLAGDLLPDPDEERILATAFNRNHMQSQEGGIVPEEYRTEYVADRANTVGAIFLGTTMECARCHDHKYDPISMKEYYEFFAFFNNINEAGQIPYSGEPSPTIMLKDEESKAELVRLRGEIENLEESTAIGNPLYDDGFREWMASLEQSNDVSFREPDGLVGHYPLEAIVAVDEDEFHVENLVRGGSPAKLGGDRDQIPKTVEAVFGDGQLMVGDSWIDLGDEIAYFERNEPFSISIWTNVREEGVSGPLFSKSGGTMNGRRGYDCYLNEDGTLSASLNHVFPDNTIEIATVDPIPTGEWLHLVMTYDGSSRADGVSLFLNGEKLAARVVTDNLKRSILHAGDGSNWGNPGNLSIGRRGEESIQDVAFEEFRVYERRLTSLEVAYLSGKENPFSEIFQRAAARIPAGDELLLRDYYLNTTDPEFRIRFADLTEVRGKENEILSALPQVMVMRERLHPRVTYVLDRGEYDSPTEEVSPGTPSALPAFPDSLPRNRLGLARWLADPEHPLTARVTVNRYWQMYFGRGIVATPEDFGNQGALPSHPDLLDWLAVYFVESGWDLKSLHRKIATSAAYQQASSAVPELRELDPDNVLLARGPERRLTAEMVRDQALLAGGLLVGDIGGPPAYPYQPEGLWEELATRNVTSYPQGSGDDLYRRSLYTIWKRTSPPPSMLTFDAAERNICTIQRQSTSTPLQSLVLLNDPQYIEASRMLGERMIREGGTDLREQIATGFMWLTSRLPFEEEAEILEGLYHETLEDFQSDAAGARDLLSVGEYARDESLPAAEVAAMTMVASTIMNFDESVMKR